MSHLATRGFHVMAKPVGPRCNLDCRYCFYLEKEKLFPGKPAASLFMSEWVLHEYLRQYLEADPAPEVAFAWQGGEPTLLGIDYFKRVLELQKRLGRGRRIENGFQTNGVLLDDAWCEFFATNGFLVGISLDGPRRLHDLHRLDKGGNPTFDQVIRAIGLLKKHGVAFNTLTVVHRHNSEFPLEVYQFLKEVGSGFLQFIPVVEREAQAPGAGMRLVAPDYLEAAQVSPWSVEPLQYGIFLSTIFDEWVRKDVGSIFVQLYDVALESWMGMAPSLCVFQETCGTAMALEHNGDLYSCDHFVDEDHRLGNILDRPLSALARSAQQTRFGSAKKAALPAYCRTCDVRFACKGECPKHRFARTPDGEPGLNYLCAGYKHFFKHIDSDMKFMAEELRHDRAPSNVMARKIRTG